MITESATDPWLPHKTANFELRLIRVLPQRDTIVLLVSTHGGQGVEYASPWGEFQPRSGLSDEIARIGRLLERSYQERRDQDAIPTASSTEPPAPGRPDESP